MDGYSLLSHLYSSDTGDLQVFRAMSESKESVVVKKYQCTQSRDLDVLLKSAFMQVSEPCPLWVKLREVVIEKGTEADFTVNLISDVLDTNLPPETQIRQDDRDVVAKVTSHRYQFERSIYRSSDTKVEVLQALESVTGTQVIIKRFGPLRHEEELNAIVKEALLQARVKSDYSTGVMDICAQRNAGVYMIDLIIEKMDRALRKDIKENKCFSEAEVLTFLYQLGSALLYAKRLGIAHRDIKPDNVLISSEGVFKLADFGCATQIHAKMSSLLFPRATTNEISGTLLYVSPEMRKAYLDESVRLDSFACDMYSLGTTAVEMAANPAQARRGELWKLMEEAEHEEIVEKTVNELPLSEALKQTVRKMLCYDDTQRMRVEELLEVVANLLQQFHPDADIVKCMYMKLALRESALERKLRNQGLPTAEEFKRMPNKQKQAKREDVNDEGLREISSIWEKYMSTQPSVLADSFKLLPRVSKPVSSSQSLQFSGQLLSLADDYQYLGWNSLRKGNFEEAINYCLRSTVIRHDLRPSFQTMSDFQELGLLNMLLPNGSVPIKPLMETLHLLKNLKSEDSLYMAKISYYLAMIYINLDDQENALKYCKDSLYIKQRLLQENHLDLANNFVQLGNVMMMKHELKEAIVCYNQALAILSQSVPEDSVECLPIYSMLIEVFRISGKPESAMFYLKKSLQISQNLYLENHPINSILLYELSCLYVKTGQHEQAAECCRKSLSIVHQSGSHPFFHVMPLLGFADLHLISGKFSEALEFCKKAQQAYEQCGFKGESTLMEVHFKSALAYCGVGRMAEAAECCQRCKELLQHSEAPYARLFKLAKLSKLSLLIGNLAETEKYCNESIQVFRTIDSATPDIIIPSLDILATVYLQIGKPAEAFSLFSETLDKIQSLHANPEYTASRLSMLALCCLALMNFTGAVEYSTKAYQLLAQSTNYVCIINSLLTLSTSYMVTWNLSDAALYSAKAVEIIEQSYPEKNQLTALAYMICGFCKGEIGNVSEASGLLQKSLDCIKQSCSNWELNPAAILHLYIQSNLHQKTGNSIKAAESSLKALRTMKILYPVDDEGTAFMMSMAAANLVAAERLNEAEECATESLRLGRLFCAEKSPLLVSSLYVMGCVCCNRGDLATAVAYLTEVVTDYQSILPDQHPILVDCRSKLYDLGYNRAQ